MGMKTGYLSDTELPEDTYSGIVLLIMNVSKVSM
jgi:hypothetical protein